MPTKKIIEATSIDGRTLLSDKLNRPIKTNKDRDTILQLLGMFALNNSQAIGEIIKVVKGENSHDGLIGKFNLMDAKVDDILSEIKQSKIVREEKKGRPKFKAWFNDKVAPNIISALTIWLFSVIAVALVLVFSPIIQAMARHAAGIP